MNPMRELELALYLVGPSEYFDMCSLKDDIVPLYEYILESMIKFTIPLYIYVLSKDNPP